jgi:hypothetical protein
VNLRTSKPTPQQVRAAVQSVLHESRYRERAKALAAEYARYDAVKIAVETIEALVPSQPSTVETFASTPEPFRSLISASAARSSGQYQRPRRASLLHHRLYAEMIDG